MHRAPRAGPHIKRHRVRTHVKPDARLIIEFRITGPGPERAAAGELERPVAFQFEPIARRAAPVIEPEITRVRRVIDVPEPVIRLVELELRGVPVGALNTELIGPRRAA